ncbi:ABC transporter ATP-binding protein [Ruminococcus flavefaciens]|uniref:ABC transporter ATP-binding protein n=1 Tax=Ruminococcus flavefaciens TaxID=1265 RepID=UPI000490937D|nr:ABC transporter ATP-binding protein [Ruminococcus flavefaciens]
MADMILRTEELSAGYGKKVIVGGLTIEARRGEILTLIGPNGAGKSTVLKTLCRQLDPLGGTVYIDGKKLSELSGNQLARKVSVLLTGRVKTEYMRCIDVVEMGRYPYTGRLGLLSSEDRQLVTQAMELVGVSELADRDFDRISDGQRQRVLLAGAICRRPDVLILDEPTTFLDIRAKLELMDLLKRLASEQNIAVILSLHELELAQRVSDRILCIRDSAPDRTGTPEEIFSGGYIGKLYGVPEGSFCEAYGSPELAPVIGEPEIFIIGGGGSGIALYRRLRRRGVPFAVGVIHENDIEYPVAAALGAEVVTEKAFEAISEEKLAEASELMKKCGRAVCTVKRFGTMNDGCRSLAREAASLGILENEENI